METTLGLDIAPQAVHAVVVGQRFNRRWIEACLSVPHGGGESLAAAMAEVVAAVGSRGGSWVSAVSAREASFHTLVMPFRGEKKIRQVLAFELEPRLLTPLDDVQFDFCATRRGSNESAVLVAAVARDTLDAFLARFRDHHIEPLAVDIRSHALATQLFAGRRGAEAALLIDLDDEVLTICQQGAVVLHRPLRQAMYRPSPAGASGGHGQGGGRGETLVRGVATTLHAYGVDFGQELRPTRIVLTGAGSDDQGLADLFAAQFACTVAGLDLAAELGIDCRPECSGQWRSQTMNTALALALRRDKARQGFNLLTGDYQNKRAVSPYAVEVRKGLVWCSLILVLLAVQNGLEYQDLARRHQALEKEAAQLFHRIFPSAQLKVDPLLQMRAMMKERQGQQPAVVGGSGVTVLALLQEISSRVSPEWKVRVVSLVVDGDTIQLKGMTDNYNTVDALKQGLAASSQVKEVTISSATLDRENSVAFELRMRKAL